MGAAQLLLSLLALLLGGVAQAAQAGGPRLELAVLRSGPGSRALVDRGRAHGLLPGTLVLFPVEGGEPRRAEVESVEEERATLRMLDRRFPPQPGTVGEAQLAAQRGAQPAPVPAPPAERLLELRVSASGPGPRVRVDRGRADGLALGDRVELAPRGAERRSGRVVALEERSAEVELEGDAGLEPPAPGTRGSVLVGAPSGAPATPPAEAAPDPGAAPAPAREPRRVELRVSSSGPGARVLVDRGASDGLRRGDRVLFQRPDGAPRWGTVGQVGNKSALVELEEVGEPPAVGARAEVLLPAERFDAPGEQSAVEPSRWRTADEGYSPDMPLLSRIQPVKPSERPRSVHGLTWLSATGHIAGDGDRSDSFTRLGTELRVQNPFGEGGDLQLDFELNYRTDDLPDEGYDDDFVLRLDRLSYARGGTRFTPARFELGRFLQHGLPELGLLDGVEWTQRLEGGDRFGASLGFLPEADAELSTGEDLQLAAWYEWVADELEELRLAAGFQKTLHEDELDRDLLVLRLRYQPPQGFDLSATAWVDFHDSDDQAKGSGAALTQAWVSSTRSFENGDGLSFSYRHLETPELLRDQVVPITPTQIAEGHYDRVAAGGWTWIAARTRLFLELGGWIDERESGGDALLGLELRDLFLEGGRGELAAFGTQGETSTVLGGRALYGRSLEDGRWELLYELSLQRQGDFEGDFGDIWQHRLRASRDLELGAALRLSLFAQGLVYDDEGSLALGFFLQKVF